MHDERQTVELSLLSSHSKWTLWLSSRVIVITRRHFFQRGISSAYVSGVMVRGWYLVLYPWESAADIRMRQS
jgi:hypothetical protein